MSHRAVHEAQPPHWLDPKEMLRGVQRYLLLCISDQLETAHSDVPWREIAGFRNVLVHQYLSVDLDCAGASLSVTCRCSRGVSMPSFRI